VSFADYEERAAQLAVHAETGLPLYRIFTATRREDGLRRVALADSTGRALRVSGDGPSWGVALRRFRIAFRLYCERGGI
jgi:hypothetical protein